MNKPLAFIAIAYVLGLVAGAVIPVPLPFLFVVAFLLLSTSLFVPKGKPILLLLALVFTGWINFGVRTRVLSANDLRARFGESSHQAIVRGTIVQSPSERRYENKGKESWRTHVLLDVRAVQTTSGWQPAVGKVMVITTGRLGETFFDGQRVEVSGVLRRPRLPVAEGLFNYRAFLERQSVHYQLDVAAPRDWRETAAASAPWGHTFAAWAQRALTTGIDQEDESLRLLWAMTLGWKTALTDEVSEPFMKSGTMHIFAISGLHIALIAGILVALLRVFRVSRFFCGVVVIPMIWFYTMSTGWQPSAIRSTVMMTIVLAGWSLKRPGNLLNSLGAAAFLILLWDPEQLFQASFQLSFFVVLSIALLMPPLEKLRDRILQHDPLLPAELRPKWKQWLDGPLRWSTNLFITSLAAWIGSLPLSAYYFHLFTPVSLLANIVVVPLSSFALMASLGGLLCAPVVPFLAGTFNASAWFFMNAMVTTSEWFAEMPAAFLHVAAPSLLHCCLYYAIVFGLVSGWLLKKREGLMALAVILLLGCVSLWQWNAERSTWRITVLPLSGGEAIYVDAPGKKDDLLVDCGSEDAVDFVTEPFLAAKGINRLPKLLLTHGDLKNVGGTESIVREFKVQNAFLSPLRFRSSAYRIIQQKLREPANLARDVAQGDPLGRWTVLYPAPDDKFSQADDGPIVLHGNILGTRLLLMSDLSRNGQRLLWDRHPDLKADIVVAGLPRESEPLNNDLLDTLQPKLIVITDAEYPSQERATKKLRDRLAERKIPVIYCRDAGAVTLRIDRKGFKTDSALKDPQPGHRGGQK